jgi:hypothetical protein
MKTILVIIVFVSGFAGWGACQYYSSYQHKRLHDYLLLQQIKKTKQYYGTVAAPQERVEW